MAGLQKVFTALVQKYTNDPHLPETLWQEIRQHYSNKKRHYHNLAHLEHLLGQLSAVKDRIEDWDVMLFCLFYHDIIYKASRNDNEEQSAEVAQKRLAALSFPPAKTSRCVAQILSTKGHAESDDPDTNYFTDADLSILGQSWDAYSIYCQQVRKEYAIYPDMMYKPGRKKVLKYFLQMERIYKTAYFFERFEMQARENLTTEFNTISTTPAPPKAPA